MHQSPYLLAQSKLRQQPKRESAAENDAPMDFSTQLQGQRGEPEKANVHGQNVKQGWAINQQCAIENYMTRASVEIKVQEVAQARTCAARGDWHGYQKNEAQ